MSEKKENREEEKEQSSSRSCLTDEQIEAALNACTFGYLREKCKNCPLDSEKEPCITNLHLAALAYIRRLKNRAEVAERALSSLVHEMYEHDIRPMCDKKFFIESRLIEAEKELAEDGKDD